MAKILNRVKVIIAPSQAMPDWSGSQWQKGMVNNSELINLKRKKKIPDQARYESRVAEASVNKYKDFIDPNFISESGLTKKGIVEKHAKKISVGFDKYDKHLDEMFAEDGKLFKQRVAGGVGRYVKNAEITMRLTGDRIRGLAAAALIPFWLVADRRIIQLLEHAADIKGKPVNVTEPTLRGPFKAGLEPLLVQAGAIILRADIDKDTIDRMNEIVNRYIAGLQDSDKYAKFQPGGDSHCDFGLETSGEFYIEAQVAEK